MSSHAVLYQRIIDFCGARFHLIVSRDECIVHGAPIYAFSACAIRCRRVLLCVHCCIVYVLLSIFFPVFIVIFLCVCPGLTLQPDEALMMERDLQRERRLRSQARQERMLMEEEMVRLKYLIDSCAYIRGQ